MSRTLSGLSWEEVTQIVQVLEQVSQPYLNAELQLLRTQGNRVRMDGDLTGIPVSNTSQTYPNAAFGHMNDDIRLGYQAGVPNPISGGMLAASQFADGSFFSLILCSSCFDMFGHLSAPSSHTSFHFIL